MANSASARKRARQNDARRAHNASMRKRIRTMMKRVVQAVEAKDKEGARKAFRLADKALAAGAGKRLIAPNKAARHKSRLNRLVRDMTG